MGAKIASHDVVAICKHCRSGNIVKRGVRKTKKGTTPLMRCNDCKRTFSANFGFRYRRHDPAVISEATHLFYSGMSTRAVSDALKVRGINVSDSAIYKCPLVVDSVQTDLGPISLVRPLYTVLASPGQISSDPALAEFSARVQLTALPFEVERNEINAALDGVPSHPGVTRNYIYAAYDAVHLLADSIAISGADSPNLKSTIYEVSNGRHALTHDTRLLGEGALGDYVLDPQTGDLIEGGTFVEYRFVQSDSGYIWQKIVENVCR